MLQLLTGMGWPLGVTYIDDTIMCFGHSRFTDEEWTEMNKLREEAYVQD